MRRARGFALPTVLFGLLLLSAVVVGAWVAAMQSVRHSRLAFSEARLRMRAAAAIAERIASWNALLDSLPPGASETAVDADGTTLRITRTGLNIFAIEAAAGDSLTSARQSIVGFARLRPLVLSPAAVVRVTQVPADFRKWIVTRDSVPVGWNCAAGQYIIDTLSVQLFDTNATFPVVGELWDWQRLSQWTSSLPRGGDSLEWRYVRGDTVLSGGRFTGVLIAEGDVILRSGASVFGMIITRGSIAFEGLGGAIFGAVVANTIELAPGTPASSASVIFSSCALRLAGRSRAPVEPLPGVPFADLY